MYLVKRLVVCDSGYYLHNNRCYPESSWYWWGRWVLTAALILSVVAILLLLGCVSARRRRRQGMAPLYGTGWMGPKYTGPPYPGNPQGYYQQGPYQQGPYQGYNNQQPPPPKYTANGYSDSNQMGGIQPPPNTYAMHSASTPDSRPEEGVYSPPPGPPPAK